MQIVNDDGHRVRLAAERTLVEGESDRKAAVRNVGTLANLGWRPGGRVFVSVLPGVPKKTVDRVTIAYEEFP